MKFVVALAIIFCAVLWINNNPNYVVFSSYTVKDLENYAVQKGGLLISKIGQDISEIDWNLNK